MSTISGSCGCRAIPFPWGVRGEAIPGEHVGEPTVSKEVPMGVFSRFGQRLREPRHRRAPEKDVPRDQVPTKAERDPSWHERTDTHVHHDHQPHGRPRPGHEGG